MTPFHDLALMFPATTEADADARTAIFAAGPDELPSLAQKVRPGYLKHGPSRGPNTFR